MIVGQSAEEQSQYWLPQTWIECKACGNHKPPSEFSRTQLRKYTFGGANVTLKCLECLTGKPPPPRSSVP
eukprot:g31583.t1